MCRFAAFWFLLDAFRVGGSVKNVLLVFGVNQVAGAVPFTPGGAGVQQALLVKVFATSAPDRRGGRLLGRPADRDRRLHRARRARRGRLHLPLPLLQGGAARRARLTRGRARGRARRRRAGRGSAVGEAPPFDDDPPPPGCDARERAPRRRGSATEAPRAPRARARRPRGRRGPSRCGSARPEPRRCPAG